MSKQVEVTPLKKGRADFNLIGKAVLNDFTFKKDVEGSNNLDYIYNKLDLKVNCGDKFGQIASGMMGGYNTASDENFVYVHGIKEEDGRKQDDFKNTFKIDWEDRLDDSLFEDIGDMCFITVGLEKDENDKTIYKKFLHEYDAITYIEKHLKDGMVLNVKGNLKFNKYKENLNVQKEIKSIVLSKAEPEKFKATFTLTTLLDSASIGKLDKDKNLVPITTYVVENVTKHDGKKIYKMIDGKRKNGANIPYVKVLDFMLGEDIEKSKKMLKTFKVKPKSVNQLTIDGYFTHGEVDTVEVGEIDIPDDIKELIEQGYIDESEILEQTAVANGNKKKPERLVIKSPHIKFVKSGDVKIPTVDKVDKMYKEDDINLAYILSNYELEDEEVNKIIDNEEEDADIDDEEALNKALESEDDNAEDDDDDWLNNLDD